MRRRNDIEFAMEIKANPLLCYAVRSERLFNNR